jgi:3-methyladenine DNA glycosylase Mpg
MSKSTATSVAAQEVEAYAHPEYRQHLEALRIAIEADEKYRWRFAVAQARIDLYRTQQANHRAMEKVQ